MNTASARIRWVSIIVGALLVEIALFVVVLPLFLLPIGATVVRYAVLPACAIAAYFGGLLVARRAGNRFVLHGALVGALAALLYAAISWKATLTTIFIVSNYLKIAAGAVGGLLAQRGGGKTEHTPQSV
jgi:putative membrane protein (TIGR04086 family)